LFKDDLQPDRETFPPMLPWMALYQKPLRIIIDIAILIVGVVFFLPVM
jgi:hypothetical protein